MRLIKLLALLFALLAFPSLALATPGEQLVKQEVIVPYFDIWQHTNGTWQDTDSCGEKDYYGWKGKTHLQTFALPVSEWQGKYELTRVEIDYSFGEQEYNNSGKQEDWDYFNRKYLTKKPANYSATKDSENLAAGEVTTEFEMDLEPELLDLKDPTVRSSLGMSEKDFSNMAQGWRWYLPVMVTWYGVPAQVGSPYQQQNLKVQITSCPGEAQPGQTVNVSGKVTNESDTPVTTLLQWYVGSKKVYEGNVTIDKTKDLNFPFAMPTKDTTVTVQVNPAHDQPPNETDWTDNKDSATIKIPVVNVPTNSQLIITARSRGGDDQFGNYQPPVTRPKGTAKWGDDITVTFHAPDEPKLKPCYKIKTWELVSAKVIYPERDPDFTFIHPLDPIGTIKKSMAVSGNSATVTFNEDWSNYGADVYDVIAGQHIPGPTLYDIKVEYEMLWEYKKGTRVCGPNGCTCINEEEYTKHPTDTVKGKILVNGTSVIPLAG